MARSAPSPAPDLPLGKKVAFAAGVCVAALALLELGLAGLGVRTLLSREDPFRGFSDLVSIYERRGDVYRTARAEGPQSFNDQSFRASKPARGLRLFTLGGSSAYGYPWGASYAFTAILGDVLAAEHPEREVEAVNAAGISYAMHRLRIVAGEVLGYEPDVLIVYSGHNEFVERTYFEDVRDRGAGARRLELWLARSRAYSLMRRLVAPQNGEGAEAAGFETFVQRSSSRIYPEAEKREVSADFEEGLRDIVRRASARGVRVLVATVPCNWAEWSPNRSAASGALSDAERDAWSAALAAGRAALEGGRAAEAARLLERARDLEPGYAETHFLLGRAYRELGRAGLAAESLRRATDRDASPIRRTSAINQAVRDVAAQEGALLVDLDRIFAEESRDGLVGFDLIEDYVHPTRESHERIAFHLWRAIEAAGWLGEPRAVERERFRAHLARRPAPPPPRNAAWFFNQGHVFQQRGRTAQAVEMYRRALEISPHHPGALTNLAVEASRAGRHAEALEYAERLLRAHPGNPGGLLARGLALEALGRLDEAESDFRALLASAPDRADALVNLGRLQAKRGAGDEALALFTSALERDPANLHANLGAARVLLAAGRRDEAVAYLERALALEPDHAQARAWLAAARAGTRAGTLVK